MKTNRSRLRACAAFASLGVLAAVVLSQCSGPLLMPAMDGAVVEIKRSQRSIQPGEEGYSDTLQLLWFGSGCHVIQLGDLSVVTDPFVTNGADLLRPRSDPRRVAATLGKIKPPQAVLINHSHFDHILDAHETMTLDDWKAAAVPLFGGATAKHLLAGWLDEELNARCHALTADVVSEVPVGRVPSGYALHATAYPSRHAPHLSCGTVFLDRKLTEPRTSPPSNALDYPAGEVFNYLLELKHGSTSFTVFSLGAVADLDEHPHSLPPPGTRIDVLILCAPGATHVKGYPEAHLNRLRPRHIVMSHFNTFWKDAPDEQLSTLGRDNVKLADQLRTLQSASFAGSGAASSRLEKLHVPALTLMDGPHAARNVILLK